RGACRAGAGAAIRGSEAGRFVTERLDPELVESLRAIAGARRLLIALDFDGTLAPLVPVASEARALPEAQEAILRLLGLSRTRVAVVSGRSLESLGEVAPQPDEVLLVGSHGLELRIDGELNEPELSTEE